MNNSRNTLRLDTSLELVAERLVLMSGPCVMATVISASGSTYRKPGARMLIEPDGRVTGLLSGGCFEQDLREHSVQALSRDVACTVAYDMRGEDDLIFGIGAGCEGCMGILLEPVRSGSLVASAIMTASEMSHQGESVALVAIHAAPLEERGTRLWHARQSGSVDLPYAEASARAIEARQSQTAQWGDLSCTRQAYVQAVLPPPSVLVCGAGPDAEPLVAGLRALHYPVTIVDHRAQYAKAANFPGATVVLGSAATLKDRVDLSRYFAAVVMSHHLAADAEYLQALAPSNIEYIGLLGPRVRRTRLLNKVGAALDIEERVRGPIGLDIGAVTPEGIALAIVAEIHAAAAGRGGGPFAHR